MTKDKNAATPAMVGGVRATAPLFKGTPVEVLLDIVRHLDRASFHRAAETGEQSAAALRLRLAATLANAMGLNAYAVRALVRHNPQLVTEDDMLDEMLKQYRRL